MSNSRTPGPTGVDGVCYPNSMGPQLPKSPYLNDYLVGDSPGPLGVQDGASQMCEVGQPAPSLMHGSANSNSPYMTPSEGQADNTIVIQGLGASWHGWEISLRGSTAIRLSGEPFFVTGTPTQTMWTPPGGSTSKLFIYKPGNPKKVFRVDYHPLNGTV